MGLKEISLRIIKMTEVVNPTSPISKYMMIHIATEVVVIGGICFYFNKKISKLQNKIDELEKKLVECCNNKENGGSGDGLSPEQFTQFTQFQQQTSQNFNGIYSAIKQIQQVQQNILTSRQNQQPQQRPQFHPQHHPQNHPQNIQIAKVTLSADSNGNIINESRTNFSILSDDTSREEEHKYNTPSKIELIEEENEEEKEVVISDELLDTELEDELKELTSPPLPLVEQKTSEVINDIKNENNIVTQTPSHR